jgi:hypothetical protein
VPVVIGVGPSIVNYRRKRGTQCGGRPYVALRKRQAKESRRGAGWQVSNRTELMCQTIKLSF